MRGLHLYRLFTSDEAPWPCLCYVIMCFTSHLILMNLYPRIFESLCVSVDKFAIPIRTMDTIRPINNFKQEIFWKIFVDFYRHLYITHSWFVFLSTSSNYASISAVGFSMLSRRDEIPHGFFNGGCNANASIGFCGFVCRRFEISLPIFSIWCLCCRSGRWISVGSHATFVGFKISNWHKTLTRA